MIHLFDSQYHLPAASLTIVNQAGNQTNNSWALEESMDVEYAHAIAPGTRILVVEAGPASSQTQELQNLLNAVNTARNTTGVVAISMSWGYGEMSNEASYDKYFKTPSGHTGITFIASSGDFGYVEYSAASPNVLSVGGTSLYLTGSGSYQSETAWFYSGGGYSSYEPEPSYQRSVQITGQRSTPDVAFEADPSTGVEIYETSPRSGKGSWQVYGGTSLGAPAWAGIIAIVDQGRALAGKGSLDGPNQTLPSLYALPTSDFHSVATFPPTGGALLLVMVHIGIRRRRRERQHRDGPRVAQRPIAHRRPGGEHRNGPGDEREWPQRKRSFAGKRDPFDPTRLEASAHPPARPHDQQNQVTRLDHGAALGCRTRVAHRDAGTAPRRPVVILATPINLNRDAYMVRSADLTSPWIDNIWKGSLMQNSRRARRALPLFDQLDDRCLLSGYTPAQITSAYSLNAIAFTSSTGSAIKGDGSGQTIALIEEYHDPKIQSDLKTFDSQYHLPAASLTIVNQAGNRTKNSWALEESMDVEYAHAIAPAARILVVEAAPANSQTKELQNQLNAVNTARKTKGVVAISMSWGYHEMANEASYDKYFTTPSGHTGITFIASSGDFGYVEYPAASPNVLSVGGTSLYLTNSGSYQSETAWFYSGGGYSAYEPEPSYQTSVQTTGQRSTPDVAFNADQSTGVEIYETPPRSRKGSWQVYAGTSLGAPTWAGIIAIADQGRALAGKGSLDGHTQTLPTLYALPSSAFHILNSSLLGGLSSWFWFVFGSGGDGANANIATGLGSPNGQTLIPDLVASNATA